VLHAVICSVFPTLYHALKDLLGLEIHALEMVNTFGLFVALAIAAAFAVMAAEFKRRTELGQMPQVPVKTVVGKPYPASDYGWNGLLAFVFGYKVLWIILESGEGFVPQEHLATSEGSLMLGVVASAGFLAWRYWEDKKQRLPEPREELTLQDASFHMGGVTTMALLFGFLGAKVFHLLENLETFHLSTLLTDLFTSGGWTFYGGLIGGAAAVLVYVHRKGLPWRYVLDAGGPAMMLAYGLGRFGCHFSGDGDWGVANLKPNPGLPDWLWAYRYPHNVLGRDYTWQGMERIPGCEGRYCQQLIDPVWPTPLYEALMALALFAVIWWLIRPRSLAAGQLFSVYLVFAGLERFLIESIREHGDSLYHLGSMVFSQAQMISVLLLLAGIASWIYFGRNTAKP